MKFNQFAHVQVPFEQKLTELNCIAFLHAGDEDLASNHIYYLFLERTFPNYKSEAAKNQALSNLAAAPRYNTKRDPESFAPLSKSRIPNSSPISQCDFGVKANSLGVPHFRISTFSSSSFPIGVVS